ncbi:MAG: hypothetical protein MUF54_08675 [Polyangiaceae bacterium]|jgi:hypothetical protein|nr:hypothetical protein [Polyangiaceae bacterium]
MAAIPREGEPSWPARGTDPMSAPARVVVNCQMTPALVFLALALPGAGCRGFAPCGVCAIGRAIDAPEL